MSLYLSADSDLFGCRACHRLTYESCQESDKRVSALRKNPKAAKDILDAEPTMETVKDGFREDPLAAWPSQWPLLAA